MVSKTKFKGEKVYERGKKSPQSLQNCVIIIVESKYHIRQMLASVRIQCMVVSYGLMEFQAEVRTIESFEDLRYQIRIYVLCKQRKYYS